MGDLAASPPPTAVLLPVLFVDGDRTVDLGTVQPSLAVKRLQSVVADRVGVAPTQISASLARPRRARRVPLEEGTDLTAAAVAREGSGCYVLAGLRRRERRGGRRARREKKAAAVANPASAPPQLPEKTILKRLPSTDLVPHAVLGGVWDYEAQLRELQRQRDWYLMSTAAAADPYLEEPPLWSPRPPACPECEAMRQPPFHWCVRDAVVTAGFRRSHVGPIERPAKKCPSPPPLPGLLGMPVY